LTNFVTFKVGAPKANFINEVIL